MGVRLEYPRFSAVDSAGAPLNGGKLYSYEAGTSTAKTLYADRDLTVATTNPVILDSSGEATIYGSGLYKLVLKTSADVTLWTLDYITLGQYYDEILLFKGSSRTYYLEVDAGTDRLLLYPDTDATGTFYIGHDSAGGKTLSSFTFDAENDIAVRASNCIGSVTINGEYYAGLSAECAIEKYAKMEAQYKVGDVVYNSSVDVSANSESRIRATAKNQWSVAASTGVVKIFPVYKASVATDEYLDLPDNTCGGFFRGRALIGGTSCYIDAVIGASGQVVLLLAAAVNWEVTDTGTNLVLYDAGDVARIKNKNAAAAEIWGYYIYS